MKEPHVCDASVNEVAKGSMSFTMEHIAKAVFEKQPVSLGFIILWAVGSPFLALVKMNECLGIGFNLIINVAALVVGFHAVTKVVRTTVVSGGS